MAKQKREQRELGSSLAGAVIRKMDAEQQERGVRVGRPPAEKKKVRLNFLFDEDMVNDLRALASIKKTTLTAIFIEAMAKEIEANRRDINILRSMQK